MPDNRGSTTDVGSTSVRCQASPGASDSKESREWGSRLWDDSWEGETGLFGGVHLCVATKKWGDGTVDVLIVHNPYDEWQLTTAYAHRQGENVTRLTVDGPADNVIETVTKAWGPPQERETGCHTA